MKKRLLCYMIALAVIAGIFSMPVMAASRQELEAGIKQCRQNEATAHEMAECARRLGLPEDHFIIREASRIWWENHDIRVVYKAELDELNKPKYTEEELDLLSRLVYAEAGCDWFPDWVQQACASVVINRISSPLYPNNMWDVIYQPGQYGPAWSGGIYNTPSQKVINNCRYVLENGPTLPASVMGQNGDATGNGIYTTYYDSVLGTTIYFTYVK